MRIKPKFSVETTRKIIYIYKILKAFNKKTSKEGPFERSKDIEEDNITTNLE
jgi:hypothetical protein